MYVNVSVLTVLVIKVICSLQPSLSDKNGMTEIRLHFCPIVSSHILRKWILNDLTSNVLRFGVQMRTWN